jgi:hypothetical protein
MTEPDFYIVPENTITVHARVNPFRGGLVFESERGLGAMLNEDSRCEKCGQVFRSGDCVEVDLAKNYMGLWRHRNNCPQHVR